MNIKERILETLKKEFEPLGYRYLKSRSIFKRNVGKDIIVHLYYNASRFHREFTIVNFFSTWRFPRHQRSSTQSKHH